MCRCCARVALAVGRLNAVAVAAAAKRSYHAGKEVRAGSARVRAINSADCPTTAIDAEERAATLSAPLTAQVMTSWSVESKMPFSGVASAATMLADGDRTHNGECAANCGGAALAVGDWIL